MARYSFSELPGKDSDLVNEYIRNFEENGLPSISGFRESLMELRSGLETIQHVAIAKGLYELKDQVRDLCDSVIELCRGSGDILCYFTLSFENGDCQLAFTYVLKGHDNFAACSCLKSISKNLDWKEHYKYTAGNKLYPLVEKCKAGVEEVLQWIKKEREDFKKIVEKRETFEADIRKIKEGQSCAKLEVNLEQIRNKESIYIKLQPVLHELSDVVGKVRRKLRELCSFWERLQAGIFPTIDKDWAQTIVEELSKGVRDSELFAEKAIRIYARWMAGQVICNRSRQAFDEASKVLTELMSAKTTQAEAVEWLEGREVIMDQAP